MPSPPCKARARGPGGILAWAAAGCLWVAAAATGQADGAPGPVTQAVAQRVPDRDDIARAIETVKADPNLTAERTIRTLSWADGSQPRRGSGSMGWLVDLATWFAQSARLLVWCAAAVLIGVAAIYVVQLWRAYKPSNKTARKVLPTHVQDLDIRPESLPDDIGATVWLLWNRGEHRAALSLLYRGFLSRLVHVHEVPIRDSSTEGDALKLARTRLAHGKWTYATRLVGLWQLSVYGGREPEAGSLHEICDGFAPTMDAR